MWAVCWCRRALLHGSSFLPNDCSFIPTALSSSQGESWVVIIFRFQAVGRTKYRRRIPSVSIARHMTSQHIPQVRTLSPGQATTRGSGKCGPVDQWKPYCNSVPRNGGEDTLDGTSNSLHHNSFPHPSTHSFRPVCPWAVPHTIARGIKFCQAPASVG